MVFSARLCSFMADIKHVKDGALAGLNTINQDKCREHRKTEMICESGTCCLPGI